MPRKSSPAHLAEFKLHHDFVAAFASFLEKLDPRCMGGTKGMGYVREALAMGERMHATGAIRSELMTGWKQATADLLEMTRDFKQDVVAAADTFLISAKAPSLTQMRRRVWRVVPKVLARGRIRNINEFYVIKNVLDDDGDDLSDEERARLEEMRGEFETGRR